VVVDDFEAPDLRPGWTASAAEIRRVEGPSGGALEIVGKGLARDSLSGAGVPLPIKDLRRIGAVAFRLAVPEGAAQVQVFLRKGDSFRSLEEFLEIRTRDWQEVVLPLRFMAGGSGGLLPDPSDLDRFQIQWDGPGGTVRIDDLRLLPGDRGEESWRPSEEDLLELAFGKGKGKILQGKHFSLLTASPAWQGSEATRFLADQEQGVALLESRWALRAPAGTRIPLLCANDLNESNALRSSALAAFRAKGILHSNNLDSGFEPYALTYPPPTKASLGKPGSDGMATYIGTVLRVHGNSWIVESLYWAYLRRPCPDQFRDWGRMAGKVTAEDFQDLLRGKPGRVPPWRRLLDGTASYQQLGALLTVSEFLAACHKAKLPKVWEALRAMDEPPDVQAMDVIARALDTTPEKLEEQWARWGAASWK